MKKIKNALILVALGVALMSLAYFAGSEWGPLGRAAAILYSFLVTLFLGAQLVAFVMSQVHYSREIENVKLKMLEGEKSAPGGALMCLVCGVDSKPVLGLFIWLVGGIVLAFILFLLWGILSGKFHASDDSARIPIQRETEG